MAEHRPITTVDTALFTLHGGELCVLLNERTLPPESGKWALPGGFVHVEEDTDLEAAARRILREKAGVRPAYLEQLATFSGSARDPRDWSISVVYYALVPLTVLATRNHPLLWLCPIDQLPQLAFDHRQIIHKALDRLRSKSTYSSLPTFLLPGAFTLAELQVVYEQVIGEPIDRSGFRRRLLGQGIIEPVEGETRRGTAHRPAQVYRLANEELRVLSHQL